MDYIGRASRMLFVHPGRRCLHIAFSLDGGPVSPDLLARQIVVGLDALDMPDMAIEDVDMGR